MTVPAYVVGICMGFIYAAFLVCIIGTLAKLGRYIRAPTHLRWELYPVPHEKAYFAVRDEIPMLRGSFAQFYHGGLAEELKEMLPEMLFLVRVFRYRRRIWFFSLAMHDGIYLILAWFVLLLIDAITRLAGIPVYAFSPNPWGAFIAWLTIITGIVGGFAIAVGTVGLFIFRLADRGMREYATFREYFNLAFIFTVVITALVAVCTYVWNYMCANGFTFKNLIDALFGNHQGVFYEAMMQMLALITFDPSKLAGLTFVTSPLMLAHQILFCLFLLYYPFSKMVHGPAKYVSYHLVNWDDKPHQEGPLHYNYWGIIKIKER